MCYNVPLHRDFKEVWDNLNYNDIHKSILGLRINTNNYSRIIKSSVGTFERKKQYVIHIGNIDDLNCRKRKEKMK